MGPDVKAPPPCREEESANHEILEHCGRDDVHEQREALQEYEGVIHASPIAMRPHEPHGFDGTTTQVTTTTTFARRWRIRWRLNRHP